MNGTIYVTVSAPRTACHPDRYSNIIHRVTVYCDEKLLVIFRHVMILGPY